MKVIKIFFMFLCCTFLFWHTDCYAENSDVEEEVIQDELEEDILG